MGCDGGTIPRRDELVRTKKKPEQKDKDAEREFRWRHCAITQQRLREPIVMCGLGRLYAKQNVLEKLLDKDTMPESCRHIKTLKDVKELRLTPNPAFKEEDKSEGLLDTRLSPFICKMMGIEMSGKFRFIGLWSCGCAISERALKQIKGTNICPLCLTPFSIEDVVVLNGGDEDVELMQVKIAMRNAKRKAGRRDKRRDNNEVKAENVVSETATQSVEEPAVKEEPAEEDAPTTSSKATLPNPQSKLNVAAALKRTGQAPKSLEDPDMKRLKVDYSVASDPKATDVYKSLFTTHKSEQEQTRAHWVTYNPFYN